MVPFCTPIPVPVCAPIDILWRIQQEIPRATALATAEFATLRLRLLKVAARVIETATRIRVAFASACPDAGVFKAITTSLRPAPT